MKRRFGLLKTIQLILTMLITVVALIVLMTDSELYQMVGRDPSVRALCILFYLTLALSYLFILYDFIANAAFRKEYRELDFAVYSDRVAGIANRYSCDAMIEKYMDRDLPPDVGCVMLDISNIREINEKFGHTGGNEAIQEFSDVLHTASIGLCFVGRNGGNKFMALFENSDEAHVNAFTARVDQKLAVYNLREDMPSIAYRCGKAFAREENVKTITQLISLSDRRLSQRTDNVTGLINRGGVDDLIGMYLGKEMPPEMGAAMLSITNIRELNDRFGHAEGNRAIRVFSDVLREAAGETCVVGRNGGTKFLALFEKAGQDEIERFISDVTERLQRRNTESGAARIEFLYGIAKRNDGVSAVNALVALSDRRLTERLDRVTGFANRASVDDIIAQYIDRPLPETVGCVMLEISNIREINEAGGYAQGNRAIARFGAALRAAADGLCFVGRNGGTKFLALFEDCSHEKIDRFLRGAELAVRADNARNGEYAVEYRAGKAFREGAKAENINRLIALADRRLRAE